MTLKRFVWLRGSDESDGPRVLVRVTTLNRTYLMCVSAALQGLYDVCFFFSFQSILLEFFFFFFEDTTLISVLF